MTQLHVHIYCFLQMIQIVCSRIWWSNSAEGAWTKESFLSEGSNYLADWSRKDWRNEVFWSLPLPWSKCQGENQSPDTSLLAGPQKGLINASQGCWGLFWGQKQYHHYQDVGAVDWKYFAGNKKCQSVEMLTLFGSRFPDKTLIHCR